MTLARDMDIFLLRLGASRKPRWMLSLRLFLLTPGFQFVFWLRLQRKVGAIPLAGPVLRRILWYGTRVCFASDVDTQARLGSGLYMPHPFGIVIGAGVRIGENVAILQRVTLGRAGLEAGRSCPHQAANGAVSSEGLRAFRRPAALKPARWRWGRGWCSVLAERV